MGRNKAARLTAGSCKNKSFLKHAVLGSALSVAAACAFLSAEAVILLQLDIAHSLYSTFAAAALDAALIAGSFLAAKRRQKNGLLLGLATAAVLCLMYILTAAALRTDTDLSMHLIKLLMLLFSGSIGGILGVDSVKKLPVHGL